MAATEGPRLHVALGDSYASGEGAPFSVEDRCGGLRPAYITGTATDGNHCHRSLSAYPYQLWAMLEEHGQSAWRLDQRACSGADSTDFGRPQTHFFGGGDGEPGNPAQAPAAERIRADLVTITMSGNDAGFGTIVRDCVLGVFVPVAGVLCSPARNPFIDRDLDSMRANYRDVLGRIDATTIVVAGYPRPFPSNPPLFCSFGVGRRIDELKMRWLNSVADRVNDTLRGLARERGALYVDVDDLLQEGNHTLCADHAGPGDGQRWINRFIPSSMEESAHPNAYFHRAEAQRIYDCLPAASDPEPDLPYCVYNPHGPTF